MDNFGEFLKCDIFGDFQTLWIGSNLGAYFSIDFYNSKLFFLFPLKKGVFHAN